MTECFAFICDVYVRVYGRCCTLGDVVSIPFGARLFAFEVVVNRVRPILIFFQRYQLPVFHSSDVSDNCFHTIHLRWFGWRFLLRCFVGTKDRKVGDQGVFVDQTDLRCGGKDGKHCFRRCSRPGSGVP